MINDVSLILLPCVPRVIGIYNRLMFLLSKGQHIERFKTADRHLLENQEYQDLFSIHQVKIKRFWTSLVPS